MRGGLAALAAALLIACSVPAQPVASPTLPLAATPSATAAPAATGAVSTATAAAAAPTECRAPASPTTAQTEGPYYKANPPERASLVTASTTGTRIVVTGYVLTRSCRPLANARVDLWQADAQGAYDNTGFAFRGYQLTNTQGLYRVETVVPGEYPGRTPHIHVKVTPAGGSTLTTQLYFPTSARNSSDGIFSPTLLVKLEQGTPLVGRFDFVLDVP